MRKDNLLGMPIYDKIKAFMDLNLKNIDIQRLTGLNENLIMVLTHERKGDSKNKYLNMSVNAGQAIADAFDKMVHQGQFPNIDPNTPNGLSLEQKIKYVFQLDFSCIEMSKLVGITPQQVCHIRNGGSSFGRIKLSNGIEFEKVFKQYLYTDSFNLVLKDVKTVMNRDVKKDELTKDIYHAIREYREGNYLIIDTHDKAEHIRLYNEIKSNVENGNTEFKIEHVDSVLNRDFELHFNFSCSVDYGENDCHVKMVNHESKIPFNLFDSSVDKQKVM